MRYNILHLLALCCGLALAIHATASFGHAASGDDMLLTVPSTAPPAARGIVFTTEGASFSPVLVVTGTPTIRWIWSDGTTSTSATPTKNFGSAGKRRQTLMVTPWSAVQRINIGYDAGDGGTYDIEFVPDQQVSKVEGLHHVRPWLRQWCSSYNQIPSLDFSNFEQLDTIECYLSTSLQQVNLRNTPNLQRACFEDCSLQALDLSGSPLLEDLRGALNNYPTVTFGSVGANTWHICIRDNPQMTVRNLFANMAQFPVISELFIWNTNQSGTLRVPASAPGSSVSIIADDNQYTSLDLSGALQHGVFQAWVSLNNNPLTAVNITGCQQITDLRLNGNQLSSASLDTLLATLDSLGRSDLNSNGELFADIRGAANPGAAGYASAQVLGTKGWTIHANSWSVEPQPPNNGQQDITFTTTGDTTNMRCDFRDDTTTATWRWSDGTTTPATSGAATQKTGLGAGAHTHVLRISNGAALRRFGAASGGEGHLVSMTGFANTPSLKILYAYMETALNSLGRTNTTVVSEYHLMDTALSAASIDQVYADAVATNIWNGSIWSSNSGTAASAANRATLQARGWTLSE
ncbi:leucine-rich repeat domain-containing protein [Megalodesulfovibrio gigas]|nr:hypothetical protein [Megalodesulfovibrio gigas]